MTGKFEEEDLSRIRPISIDGRESKVSIEDFVDPEDPSVAGADASIKRLIDRFPRILKGDELRKLVGALRRARDGNREILWLVGAHVIKCGLSLYVNSLIEKGYITSIAATGSATVHDLELAFFGRTSEDVAVELPKGRFGMAEETASHFVAACRYAGDENLGLGEGVGKYVEGSGAPNTRYSIFARAQRRDVAATVHVAFGTDITHQHPSFPASLVGELTMRDFRILSRRVGRVFDEGVVIVFGSAVVLPEVFLKAVSIGYNMGRAPRAVTAANFDMLPQYRVTENVLTRPFKNKGDSYSFHGHHEIMLPLLWALLTGE